MQFELIPFALLVAGQCCHFAAAADQSPPPLEISRRSYLLRAELRVEFPQLSNRFAVEEAHSHWQNRSTVRYRILSTTKRAEDELRYPEAGVFFANSQEALLVERRTRNCTLISFDLADEFFNLGVLKNLQLGTAIIGPSKLLQFSANKLNASYSQSRELALGIENVELIKFDYKLNSDAEYSLVYHADRSRGLIAGIPYGAAIRTGAGRKYKISYRFKSFELLPEEPLFGSSDSLVRQFQMEDGESATFEAFAIEAGLGCSSTGAQLDWSRDPSALSKAKLNSFTYRFAFKSPALVTRTLESVDHYVSYEPSIRTLRVDRQTPTRLTETLVNFQTGDAFHAIKRLAAQDLVLDEMLDVRRDATADDELNCVAADAAKSPDERGFTLGPMLFGATRVTYLGLARVRGIEAHAYEAFNSSWPIWYKLPLSLLVGDQTRHTISTETQCKPNTNLCNHLVLNTLFFIAKRAPQEPAERELLGASTGHLLQLEISKVSAITGFEFQRTVLPIYDFSWQLSGGQSLTQISSLGDACAARVRDDNHYGEMSLMLQRRAVRTGGNMFDQAADWLRQPRRRELALLQMVQEQCALPAHLVYDLESHLEQTEVVANGTARLVSSLLATMRVAEHVRSVAKLVFLGTGDLRHRATRGLKSFEAGFFQSCFWVAAHMQVDTLLFYSPLSTVCEIYRQSDLDSLQVSLDDIFTLGGQPAMLECYRVLHTSPTPTGGQGDELGQLAQAQRRINKLGKLKLTDPVETGELELLLKSLDVRELDHKSTTQVDKVEFADTNKFIGFGLIASGGGGGGGQGDEESGPTWRVEHDRLWMSENTVGKLPSAVSQMTYGSCEAACLTNFNCRSFSVCLRDSKLDCLLTRADFRQPELVSQLASLRDKRAKLGEQFELNWFDDERGAKRRLLVRKQPTCELHNKVHASLFHRPRKTYINVLRRRLHPVASREQCASKCVNLLMATLESEVTTAHKTSGRVLANPESQPKEIELALRNIKYSNLNLCTAFSYIDRANFLAQSGPIRTSLERLVPGNFVANGYCVLGDSLTDTEISILANATRSATGYGALSRLDIEAEQFEFDFSFMFERHQGVSLARSRLSAPLRRAYKQITASSGQKAPPAFEAYELVRNFLAGGENLEHSIVEEPSECARICFMQLSRLWPACKSFDVFEMNYKRGRETHCFFNTQSLSGLLLANRNDLITTSPNEQRRMSQKFLLSVAHFEPKGGLIGESLALESQLELAELGSELPKANERITSFTHLGVTFSLLLVLVVGLATGLMLGDRILQMATTNHRPREDEEQLASMGGSRDGELYG